ncbi:hypothetical protein QQZ08_009513 [Neonectria magnoliae]|uniref:Uncharacterized protein n=1 Tax=Neonectria magnoliae TaxID=2732573 RepID=A0ABR1HPJ3_9HYPO
MANDLYKYDPSLIAAVIFILCFSISGLYHAFQIAKLRSWYFISFFVGCLVEAIGYTGRAINAGEASREWTKGLYIIQTLFLLLGPPFFAASIYMVLGRLIRLLEAEKFSVVRLNWLTKIFLFGDIASICVQAIGGGVLSSAETSTDRNKGEMIIIIGLWIQLIFFGVFIIAIIIFHRRIHREPTSASLKLHLPWQKLLIVLYVSSALIMVRSIFRVIEYIMGDDSVLMVNEVYIYLFDATLMFIVCVGFNVFHPSSIINGQTMKRVRSIDSSNELGNIV